MPSRYNGPQGQSYTCTRKLLKRLTLLSFLLILTPATAQEGPPPASTTAASTTALSTSTTLTTAATAPNITALSSQSIVQLPSLTTTPSSASLTASTAYPTNTGGNYFPPGTTSADKTISQYYYIIILAAAVVLAAFIWLLHLRRRRRKLASRSTRESALAQDINGYPSHRRWLHGAWRGGDGHSRHEEGLDERGEAPPPYKASEPTDSSVMDDSDYRGESSRGSDTVSIPLRTYHPTTSHGQKPPEYGEAIRPVNPDVGTRELPRTPTEDRYG